MTEHEKRIREALEAGPTEGPFEVVRESSYCYDIKTTCGYIVATTHGYVGDQVDSRPTANFIAACNPSAIRALLADLDNERRENNLRKDLVASGNELVNKLNADLDAVRGALEALVLNIDAGGVTMGALYDARAALKGASA